MSNTSELRGVVVEGMNGTNGQVTSKILVAVFKMIESVFEVETVEQLSVDEMINAKRITSSLIALISEALMERDEGYK